MNREKQFGKLGACRACLPSLKCQAQDGAKGSTQTPLALCGLELTRIFSTSSVVPASRNFSFRGAFVVVQCCF